MVVGCFDLLHPSHLVFLNKAASFGQLYVSLGSDQSIVSQKSRSPTFSEQERRFMLENLRCVYWVGVVSDPGPTGFREHVEASGANLNAVLRAIELPEAVKNYRPKATA